MTERVKRVLHFCGLFLCVVHAGAQAVPAGTAELRQVKVTRSTKLEVKVEISLSKSVTPEVIKAKNPSRLIVVLPGTTVGTGRKKISAAP